MDTKIRALLWEELRVGGAIAGAIALVSGMLQVTIRIEPTLAPRATQIGGKRGRIHVSERLRISTFVDRAAHPQHVQFGASSGRILPAHTALTCRDLASRIDDPAYADRARADRDDRH